MGAGKALMRALKMLPKTKKKKLTDSIADASEYKVEGLLKKAMREETESGMPWLTNPHHKDAPPEKLTQEDVEYWLHMNKYSSKPAPGTPDALKGMDYVGWGHDEYPHLKRGKRTGENPWYPRGNN